MNIGFRFGFYGGDNYLFQVEADLNASPEYYSGLKDILKIKKVPNYYLARVGNKDRDGGYIMVNDFQKEGIAYSFGINRDTSWDLEMAERGYQVYMYDHTVSGYTLHHPSFHFFKEGLGRGFQKSGPVNSLKNYILRNLHKDKKNMILKIDVEGGEWAFLETVEPTTLSQFDQIVIEFHDLVKSCPETHWRRRLELMKKLNETHQIIHIHGNNTCFVVNVGNSVFSDSLEVTYVLKDKYETVDAKNIVLPISSDCPNDGARPDLELGRWNDPFVC